MTVFFKERTVLRLLTMMANERYSFIKIFILLEQDNCIKCNKHAFKNGEGIESAT